MPIALEALETNVVGASRSSVGVESPQLTGRRAEVRPVKPKFIPANKWAQRRETESEYEVGETMSDETYLLQRIMGLETELNYVAESSRQQQIRHNTELSRLQNENRKLQARLGVLQAENNTLRVQLNAGLSVISYLEQRLKFHLQSLLEQEATAETTHRLSNAA
jgi:hypothetical protein